MPTSSDFGVALLGYIGYIVFIPYVLLHIWTASQGPARQRGYRTIMAAGPFVAVFCGWVLYVVEGQLVIGAHFGLMWLFLISLSLLWAARHRASR